MRDNELYFRHKTPGTDEWFRIEQTHSGFFGKGSRVILCNSQPTEFTGDPVTKVEVNAGVTFSGSGEFAIRVMDASGIWVLYRNVFPGTPTEDPSGVDDWNLPRTELPPGTQGFKLWVRNGTGWLDFRAIP